MMKKEERKTAAIIILGFIVLFAPYMYSIKYAVPSSDDFVMALKVADNTNLVSEAIRIANEYWFKWAGDWISIFIQIIFNPVILFGSYSKMYGVVMNILFLLFAFTMGWAIRNIFYYGLKVKDAKIPAIVTWIVLAAILNCEVWTEVFYWFVGSTYLQGMLFGASAIALLMRFREKGGLVCGILMSIMGFFGCSFYMLAVFPGGVYLICIFLDYINDKKIYWKKDIPIVIWGIGLLSGLLAPGNFARLGDSGTSGSFSFSKVLVDAVVLCFDTLFDLIENPLVLIAMLCMILLGAIGLKNVKFEFKYPLVPFILTAICLYITYIPIALGYGGTHYLPNRIRFIFCTYGIWACSAACIYLGGWISRKYEGIVTKKNVVTVLVALAAFGYVCIIPTKYLQELPYIQTASQLSAVRYANEAWTYMFWYIENSEEDDLYLSRGKINSPLIREPGFGIDPEDNVNQTIAEYFGKKSITLELW